MKNLFLLLGFVFLISASSSAQTCSHGAKSAEAKSCVKPSETAMKAAANDPSIETKVCENGTVCFIKSTKDAQGNVSKTSVKYDEATASFVSLPAAEAGASTGKSCSSSKACCAKGAAGGKACCKSKSTASVQTENVAPAAAPAKSE